MRRQVGLESSSGSALIWVVWRSLGARAFSLPLSLIGVLLTTRYLVENFGEASFGTYALVASIPSLLPIADLGLGSSVTDRLAVASGRVSEALNMLRYAFNLLTLVGLGLALVALVITIVNGWPFLLGESVDPSVGPAVGAAIGLFLLTIPLSLGHRVLLGLEANHISAILQGIIPLSGLLGVVGLSELGVPFAALLVVPALSQAVVNLWAFRIALRRLSMSSGAFVYRCFKQRLARAGAARQVFAMGVPMAIVGSAIPIAFQSDRLILSHGASPGAVAEYSAGSQVFTPALSLVSVAAMSLWPRFAAGREDAPKTRRRSYLLAVAVFGAISTVLAIAIVALGPVVLSFTTAGVFSVDRFLLVSFGAFLVVQALHLPGGMFMMDTKGLKLQAVFTSAMAVANVTLSLSILSYFGSAAPVIASVFSVLVFSLIPTMTLVFLRTTDSKG